MSKHTSSATIVYPELRLVVYDDQQRAHPAISVSGAPLNVRDLNDQKIVEVNLNDLRDLMKASIKVRTGGGGLALPDSHNNHPAIAIAKQLINACEGGRLGYKVSVSDDATHPGRQFMLFQVTKF